MIKNIAGIEKQMETSRKKAKKEMSLLGKASISIGGLAVFFIIFFLIIDTPVVSRYKEFMWEHMNMLLNDHERMDNPYARVVEDVDFEKLEKKVPFKVPKPAWLPEDYQLEYIDYSYNTDIYNIRYKYLNENKKNIDVNITNQARTNIEDSILVEYEKVEIGELEVIILGSSDVEWQANYINEQGLEIFISTLEDRETLLKIIENMS